MSMHTSPYWEKEVFDHLIKVLSSPKFLHPQGLGKEIPFFIYPFPPEKASQMEELLPLLKKGLAAKQIPVLEINLYDLAEEILRREGDWEMLLEAEPEASKEEFLEELKSLLSPEEHLLPAMERKIEQEPHQILFLTGVGEVFPFIRTHGVLSHLQRLCKETPLVLFFPGKYLFSPDLGTSLQLFGTLKNQQYYRAFNLKEYFL